MEELVQFIRRNGKSYGYAIFDIDMKPDDVKRLNEQFPKHMIFRYDDKLVIVFNYGENV